MEMKTSVELMIEQALYKRLHTILCTINLNTVQLFL